MANVKADVIRDFPIGCRVLVQDAWKGYVVGHSTANVAMIGYVTYLDIRSETTGRMLGEFEPSSVVRIAEEPPA